MTRLFAAGLSEEQITARAALRTRQLLRTSQGESSLSSDLNQLTELLKAFDNMVLKAFRDTNDVASMLMSDEFWKEVDHLEGKLAEEEDLAKLEFKLGKEIEQLEKEMKQEAAHLQSIISGTAAPTEQELADLAEEELVGENVLYTDMPSLRRSILMKRYAKYRIYSQGVAEMQREHNLDPSKYLKFKEEGEYGVSGFASGARALWKRTMRADHVKKQREAEKGGAFLPLAARPDVVFNGKKLNFVGPVFGCKKREASMDESMQSSLDDSVQEEEFVPGTRWIPPPMPELRPPAPKMPTRNDLNHASWARPGQTAKDTTDRAKLKFFEAHLPKVRNKRSASLQSASNAVRLLRLVHGVSVYRKGPTCRNRQRCQVSPAVVD